MTATYIGIASITLGTATSSVTFSAIPNTFTDLVIRASVRGSESGTAGNLRLRVNGDTGSNYSRTRLYAYGSGTFSERNFNQSSNTDVSFYNQATSTTNTFSNLEIYIPSYLSTSNKPISGSGAVENNSSTDNAVGVHAFHYRNSSAITSIEFINTAGNFVSGSTFHLYGISNA